MRRLLIDTDPGIDDSRMIQWALKAPEVQVKALTTVFGNTTVELATRNALINLEIAGRQEIPVARGACKPLVRTVAFSLCRGHSRQRRIGRWRLACSGAQAARCAGRLLPRSTYSRSPGNLTLVTAGPLTNLALSVSLELKMGSVG
jgi:inosine-uridine nucleoside N-ribohydrolase